MKKRITGKRTIFSSEMSYIDYLTALRTDIEADAIPEEDKREILNMLSLLFDMLWKYSA